MRFSRSWLELAALCVVAACGPAHPAAAQNGAPGPAAAQDPSLPPAGFGSLRQDQIGVTLGTPTLRIRVIPLDERVIRLLSPDAYQSLLALRNSRADDIHEAVRNAGRDSAALFMVTFFGMQQQARFNPDDLLIASQNATYRPIGHVPVTPRFNENLLDAREQAAAIYLYEPSVEILRPFTVLYGAAQSDAWSQALNLLNAERSRVLARASQAQGHP
jgi:hypothetical protein